MRATKAGMGEAEPTVFAMPVIEYDVNVVVIRAGYQTVPLIKGNGLPPIIDSVTKQ